MKCQAPLTSAALAGLFVGLALAGSLAAAETPAAKSEIVIGSKKFTESVILGEILRGAIDDSVGTGATPILTTHRRQLGGTRVVWNALLGGEIDAYAEYTGTLAQEILSAELAGPRSNSDESTPDGTPPSLATLRSLLAAHGVGISEPLGFENTYALGMVRERAADLGIEQLSDLASHPGLRLGFTNEFMDRADGWPGLRQRYRLPQTAQGLDHDLAYRGLVAGSLDLVDLYSTDAEIREYDLFVVDDDLDYFPEYRAVVLYRLDLDPRAVEAIRGLQGTIDADAMVAMNARAKIDGSPEGRVAADWLGERFGLEVETSEPTRTERVLRRTREHLVMVAIALFLAIALAVPAGIAGARRPRLAQALLAIAGVLQTIPALALLVFMIPLFGIGTVPSIAALFLYSLLPILRNTIVGLESIPRELLESATVLGLDRRARLLSIELPLASRQILAGVKLSAVIVIGTATLGALIGAGGYGQPILTGIRLDDLGRILEGAIPAAGLALAVQGLFELAERWLVPRGLRVADTESTSGIRSTP